MDRQLERRTRGKGAIAAGLLLLAGPAGCGGGEASPDGATASASERPSATSHDADVGTGATTTRPRVDRLQRNGRITSAQAHFEQKGVSSYDWLDFDPVEDNGLHSGLEVVGPEGPEVALTCPRDFPCNPHRPSPNSGAALGPGRDELTTVIGDGLAQVIGFDGGLRRTIDLTATITDDEDVTGLDWSPDGRRLAVVTSSLDRERIWLVDGDESAPELAYTSEAGARAWGGPQWSPDGQRLLLETYDGGLYGADVVVLGLLPESAADPAAVEVLYRSDRHFDWAGNVAWSPDGTRIAVRTKRHVTVIAADDGSVLAQRPPRGGWLIWLSRDR